MHAQHLWAAAIWRDVPMSIITESAEAYRARRGGDRVLAVDSRRDMVGARGRPGSRRDTRGPLTNRNTHT
jgi:hypothetical protein